MVNGIGEQNDEKTNYYCRSEAEKHSACKEIVEISKYIKEQCLLCQLPYYETSHNREQVISDFIKSLEEQKR